MAKIKLTKNELKRQKDNLKKFLRFLPSLILKKQQLQMELNKAKHHKDEKASEIEVLQENFKSWISVLGEDVHLSSLISIESVKRMMDNIAGVDIPVFQEVQFKVSSYSLYETPLWVDQALEMLKKVLSLLEEIKVIEEQVALLAQELRITTQRVNLFEKMKIPEAKENIRVIQIYLGDQQTAAVVRGKISKSKIIKAEEAAKELNS